MASSIFSLLFLAVFLVSLSHIVLSSSSKFFLDSKPVSAPKTIAEKFIRQLNLFPKFDINIVSSKERPPLITKQRLYEKKLNLSYLGDSDATVQDLGHHAGYYHLPHSKAARFYFYLKLIFQTITH